MKAVSQNDAPPRHRGKRRAVYWAPGHIPVALEDCEYVDFSPTDQFSQVISHIQAQGG